MPINRGIVGDGAAHLVGEAGRAWPPRQEGPRWSRYAWRISCAATWSRTAFRSRPADARACRAAAAAACVVKRSSQHATGRPKRPSSWRAKRRARAVMACAAPSACVGSPTTSRTGRHCRDQRLDRREAPGAVRARRLSPADVRFRCPSRRWPRRCDACRSRRRERSPPESRARSPSPPRITRVRRRRTAGRNRCRAASLPPAVAARPVRRTARRDPRPR